MEIFQTIWNAISIPNEGLINILIRPLSFIEITVVMLFYLSILNITCSKKQKLMYVTFLSVWSIFAYTLINNSWLGILNIVVFITFAHYFLKLSFFKCIIAEAISFIAIAVLEPIIINILTFLGNITYNEIAVIPIYRLIYWFSLYLSIYLIYRLINFLNFNITLLDNINKRNRNVLILNSIFGIIAIFVQRYLSNYCSNYIPLPIIILSTISLLVYFCISMYSLIRTIKLEITEQNLEEAQLYNKSLKILHDNVRAFKHDFSNIVQAIGRVCWN